MGLGGASTLHAEVGHSNYYDIHNNRKTLDLTVDAVSSSGVVFSWSIRGGDAGFCLVTSGQPARFGQENPDTDFLWRVMIYMEQDASMIQPMPVLRRIGS